VRPPRSCPRLVTDTPVTATPTASPLPAVDRFHLGTRIAAQVPRGAYVYSLITSRELRATWLEAQVMCSQLPRFPGSLATIYSAEDMRGFSQAALAAAEGALRVWVGLTDRQSPGAR
jgi:hypothetical protein